MPLETSGGRSLALLFLRLALGALFLYTGYQAARSLGDTTAMLASKSYPAPKVMAILAMVAQLAGGASLVLGALTPLGCIALILFLALATYSFHLSAALAGNQGQIIETIKNLSLIGALWTLLAVGPGRFSVDGRVMRGVAGTGIRR
jgi:putative oxidoreductase